MKREGRKKGDEVDEWNESRKKSDRDEQGGDG